MDGLGAAYIYVYVVGGVCGVYILAYMAAHMSYTRRGGCVGLGYVAVT